MHFSTLLIIAAGVLSSVEAVPHGRYPMKRQISNSSSQPVGGAPASGQADVNLDSNTVATTVSQLKTADSALAKLLILDQDSDWLFDFNAQTAGTNGEGGTITTANLASMPATEIAGMSMAIGVMGPCGFVTPHSHPRANELNLVIQGTLQSSMTLENGARNINQTIGTGQMTIFPQGSMHFEINPDCTNSTFVSAFSTNDAGVQQTTQTYLEFGDQIIQGALGGPVTVNGQDIDTFRSQVPENIAAGIESCLSACNLQKRSLEETSLLRRSGQLRY